MLVTVPNAASAADGAPAGGWPVLIFQHGITRNREDMFAVADSFGAGGFAVVAIDLPLHGVTSRQPGRPAWYFYAAGVNPASTRASTCRRAGSIERTFDLDAENNITGAPCRTASSILPAFTSST